MLSFSRKKFIRLGLLSVAGVAFPGRLFSNINPRNVNATQQQYDVIIIGGSYAGLSAAMALGRSRRSVLIIDSGKPCNRQTPHAHNLITHDGEPPAVIRKAALDQVLMYPTVKLIDAFATGVEGAIGEFIVATADAQQYRAQRVVLATGVRDIPLPVEGFAECWGISVLHCPYCHGYEVRDATLGVIGTGDHGFEYARMVRNWSPDLTVLTNGPATFTDEQMAKLRTHGVKIDERGLSAIIHENGEMSGVKFKDGGTLKLDAMFARGGIEQHSDIAAKLGCEFQTGGMVPELIKTDAFGHTSVAGVYAAGDNTMPMRSLANAISAGATTGAVLNNELIAAAF